MIHTHLPLTLTQTLSMQNHFRIGSKCRNRLTNIDVLMYKSTKKYRVRKFLVMNSFRGNWQLSIKPRRIVHEHDIEFPMNMQQCQNVFWLSRVWRYHSNNKKLHRNNFVTFSCIIDVWRRRRRGCIFSVLSHSLQFQVANVLFDELSKSFHFLWIFLWWVRQTRETTIELSKNDQRYILPLFLVASKLTHFQKGFIYFPWHGSIFACFNHISIHTLLVKICCNWMQRINICV